MLDIIQSLWMGGPLSNMEKLSIRSFVKNGHPYHLYTYGEVSSVPDGAVVMDANEIIPSSMAFTVRGGYSSFSDFFRWKLVRDRGGWWADTDTVCLKPFKWSGDYVFVGGFGKPGSADCVSSGMFKAPKGSPIMKWGWEQCQKMNPETMTWGQAGPPLFTEAVHAFELTNRIVAGDLFFPVFYTEAPRAFTDIYKPRISPACFSIHLFNEMWRLAGVDKNGNYPSSLYQDLIERFQ